MQKLYVFIANSIFSVTGRLSYRVRSTILFLCCFTLMCIYFFGVKSLDKVPGNCMVTGSLITVIMIAFSINGETGPVKWRKITYLPMILFGAGILLIGMLHSVGDGFVMFALDLMLIYPMLYFVWINRGDHETLYTAVSAAILLLGFVSFLYCLFLAFKGGLIIIDNRVAGYKKDFNFLGMLGMVIIIAGLYLFTALSDKLKYVVISSLGTGIGLAYIIMAGSRTAILAVIVCFGVKIIFVIKGGDGYKPGTKEALIRLVIFILAVSAMSAAGQEMVRINARAVNNSVGSAVPHVALEVYAENEVQTEPAEEDDTDNVFERMIPSGDINSFSSGRLYIWSVYLDNLSWLGKPPSYIEEQLAGAPATRAHNNFLDYYYRCGYVVGTFYVVFYFAIGLYALIVLFDKKCNRPKHIFLVMIIATYMIYAMLEISMLPFMRVIPCLFFLTIAPAMGSTGK